MESIRMPSAAEVAELFKKYGFSIATRVAAQVDSTADEHELLVQAFYNLHARPAGSVGDNAFVELFRAATRLALGDLASEFRGQDGEGLFMATLASGDGLSEEAIAELLGVPRRTVRKRLQRFRQRTPRLDRADDARLQRLLEPAAPIAPQRLVLDLDLERYLVDDLNPQARRSVHARLERSAADRARLDVLLKQRLIFLADSPPAAVAEQVAELLAVTPIILPDRHWGRVAALPVAAVAVVGLLAAGLISRAAASDDATALPSAGARPPVAVATGTAEVSVDPRAAEPPAVVRAESHEAPEPDTPAPVHRVDAANNQAPSPARLILRVRSKGVARLVGNGDRLQPSDRVIPWVELDESGYVGVIGVRDDGRARVYSEDPYDAILLPAGGPTRIGRPRPPKPALGPTRERFLLLYSGQPFAVLPIVRRLRHSNRDITDLFDGAVRSIDVQVVATADVRQD